MTAIEEDILHRLSSDQTEALSLKLYDRLSIATIAVRMDKSEDAVKKLIRRGLANLGASGVAFDPDTLQPLPIGLPNPLDISPSSFDRRIA